MAVTYPKLEPVLTTDTFEEWRKKTNSMIVHTEAGKENIGDLGLLSTDDKFSIVNAINEVDNNTDTNTQSIGNLTLLESDISAVDLVSAINNNYSWQKTNTDSQIDKEVIDRIAADLAIQSLSKIQTGIKPVAQLNSGVTLAPKITKNDGKINWHENTSEVFNRYRALSGNPGIWTLLEELRLKIDSLEISNRVEKISPAEVLISDEHLLVGANNGVIEIKTLTPAGRSQMSAAEFIRGLTNKSGLQLG